MATKPILKPITPDSKPTPKVLRDLPSDPGRWTSSDPVWVRPDMPRASSQPNPYGRPDMTYGDLRARQRYGLRRVAPTVPGSRYGTMVTPTGRETFYNPLLAQHYDKYYDKKESIDPNRVIYTEKGRSGYYSDPITLDIYNSIIESTPKESLPDWLPIDGIQGAYKFLSYVNEDKPVEDWTVPKGSDIYNFLESLELPPADMLFPHQYMNA